LERSGNMSHLIKEVDLSGKMRPTPLADASLPKSGRPSQPFPKKATTVPYLPKTSNGGAARFESAPFAGNGQLMSSAYRPTTRTENILWPTTQCSSSLAPARDLPIGHLRRFDSRWLPPGKQPNLSCFVL